VAECDSSKWNMLSPHSHCDKLLYAVGYHNIKDECVMFKFPLSYYPQYQGFSHVHVLRISAMDKNNEKNF